MNIIIIIIMFEYILCSIWPDNDVDRNVEHVANLSFSTYVAPAKMPSLRR